MPLEVGTKAPDFALPRQDGTLVSLSDFRGKDIVLLAFHPKSFTGG